MVRSGLKSAADRLGYYVSHFDTVEIDSSFYGFPASSTTQRQSPDSDRAAVAALADRLVHHTEVIVTRGESYRWEAKAGNSCRRSEGSDLRGTN